MRLGLAARIFIAGTVVVFFLAVEFVLLLQSFGTVHRATVAEQRAEASVVAAVQLEKLVLDLETGSRGYIITHDPTFLQPWTNAQKALPAQSHLLMTLAPGPATDRIDAAWRRYLREWSLPVVTLARHAADSARLRIESGEGKRLVDTVRRVADPFIVQSESDAALERHRVAKAEHQGVVTGITGIAITIVLFLGVFGYFLGAIVSPLRRLAAAIELVSEGELDVLVPEVGAGEVGQLAVAFNEMARSLAQQQSAADEQTVDLERLANVLRAVLDSTVDGILLSDADGDVQLANRPIVALTRELGMTFEGSVVDRLLSVSDRMREPEKYREEMERLRANPGEVTFNEFEDAVTGRVFQGWTAPVHDDRGGFVGRIWTMRDVTQQVELDRLKDEFVATVSHELRTPLTSMMGFLEMIREGEAGALNDEQQRFLAIVYRSSERLQRLVGDLLFVARLDASGLQLAFAEANVSEIVREAIESSASLAVSRSIEVKPKLAEVPPVPVDRERLSQLFGNLLSNALKFTPSGGTIDVRSFVEDGSVVVEVEDDGIGIPEAEQERLFQRFFRSSTATAQAIPGTGLGLVISKAIAEGHGGGITVRSKPGVGTCFRVRVPLEREEVSE